MSDPKRVYTKLEQSSLRLALGDSFRSAIHCPQCHRLDAFNFDKLKNNNFGYRCESRTSLNGSVRPPGCGKTVASGYIHEAIFSSLVWISSPLTITLHEWLLRLPKSALPRQVLGCLVLLPHVAPLYAASQRTHQLLPLAALQPAKLLTRETLMPALLSVLLKLNTLMQRMLAKRTLSCTNSAPLLLWTTMSKNILKTGRIAWMKKMPVVRHTTTSLHLLSIVQSLEYATQCTLPLLRTYALPPLLQHRNRFVPRASPVQDPSLSRILDMLAV
ncbi:hypothetical protein DSO57_1017019 [Entomophthora muscae]|uniref:Uncharacterized protein n=1 Tax=Entomophthora muscae TaxID=34485 RepID=A0ACC2TRL2_9FUNG|nr:hypothetical protein DSO57_1017019 [Entomophthora muscae]